MRPAVLPPAASCCCCCLLLKGFFCGLRAFAHDPPLRVWFLGLFLRDCLRLQAERHRRGRGLGSPPIWACSSSI